MTSTDLAQSPPAIDIALFQPDIPGNTGAILRLGACLGARIHIIEPAGFDLSDKALKRAGHGLSGEGGTAAAPELGSVFAMAGIGRAAPVLLTTRATVPYTAHRFMPGDVLVFGRESSGVPDHVHAAADIRLTIPMASNARSINLALSVAMVAGEAMRQTVWTS